MTTMKLTIFYDGKCPLCNAEMTQLKQYDQHNAIALQDLHAKDFSQRYPHIDPVAADKILHGQLQNGELLLGLDVTARAWSLVGKHKWIAILRWPIIRTISDVCYLFFARNRNAISALFMKRTRCNSCQLNDHSDLDAN